MSMLKREWLPEEWKCVFIFLSSPSRLRRQRLNESLHHRRELQYMLRLGRKAEHVLFVVFHLSTLPVPLVHRLNAL
jgi:hypothetical protein